MTRDEEAKFEANAEKMLAGHRQPPNGRNMLAFRMRHLDNSSYRNGVDIALPRAPSGPQWWEDRFCHVCDRVKSMCLCVLGQVPVNKGPRFMAPKGVIKG